MRQMMIKYDKDQSGHLDAEELCVLLSDLGEGMPTVEQAKELMASVWDEGVVWVKIDASSSPAFGGQRKRPGAWMGGDDVDSPKSPPSGNTAPKQGMGAEFIGALVMAWYVMVDKEKALKGGETRSRGCVVQ